MTARRPLLLVLAAVAVGAALGIALLVGGGDDLPPPDPEGAPGPALRTRTSVEPRLALVGEPVTAVAEFLVDPGRVDPSTVRVDGGFEPLTLAAATRSETGNDDLVRVRYRFRLACSSPACVPSDVTRELELPPGRVVYLRRAPLGDELPAVRSQDLVEWPAVTVASRLGPFDVEQARWRAELGTLPEVTRRASPGVLAAALFGGSALLALLGLVLLGSQLRVRRAVPEAAEEEQRVTALERALAGVSSANGMGDDRRRSLERLARELSATGRGELAARARRLAWSPRGAPRPEVESLAADVRAVLEEER